MKGNLLSRVQLFANPWTAAYQAPPSMGFSRQEYWSGVPLPSPYDPTIPLMGIYLEKNVIRKHTCTFSWNSLFHMACLLVGAFNPFAFKVIINMYDPITVFLIV